MNIDDLIGPLITAIFVLALIAEAIMPRESQISVRGWRWLGVLFFAINAVINTGVPLLLPVEWIASHSLLPGMNLGVAGGIAVGFIAWTFVYYWLHRAEHRLNFLWRTLHQLHHSAQRVDIAGFPFTHPLEMVVTASASVLLTVGVLGLHPVAVGLVGLYSAIAAAVQHANVRTPTYLEWLMQRPEAHARHHEYGEHAGNYADWPVWDKLFGTYRAPVSQTLRYGFDDTAARRIGAMLAWQDVNSLANGSSALRHRE